VHQLVIKEGSQIDCDYEVSQESTYQCNIWQFYTHFSFLYMDTHEGPTGPKHVAYTKRVVLDGI